MRRVSLRTVISAVAVALVLAGLGVGAYFVGRSGGEDLAAAREAGTSAGLAAGEHRGEHRGYERGFEGAKAQSFSQAYAEAFRREYASAFRRLGVPPPLHVNVPDVQPNTSEGG
jgi:hypothetical protein